ncbi:MAG: gliding motility-associated C-terminal domain-containing protein [Deltaproteobacteria bacterium]
MDGVYRPITDYSKYFLVVFAILLGFHTNSIAQEFTAKSIGSYGNIAVMEVTGNYDANNPDTTVTALPRRIIANEFFKTYKDEYDFIVIFSNFDFLMPKPQALAFYHGVKNDTKGIGLPEFDNTALYGSSGKLQGMVDMGNTAVLVSDPLNQKFENSLNTLSHELMHRWSAFVKFKGIDGNPSSALLGEDGMHWSFLLDSYGSLMYGNHWQDNGNGTFTSIAIRKNYSPLDLYLMGFVDKTRVPAMQLIENPDINPARMPELGATIAGTSRYITIDDIIAVEGERIPTSADSQKTFKIAFILVTRPGAFTGNELSGIETMRQEWLKRYSILTDGMGLIDVDLTPRQDIPEGGGYPDPIVAPRPLPPNIEDGVNWLMANQKAEGNWMDLSRTSARDTTETLLALKNFSSAQQNYAVGIQWLADNHPAVTDYLARKIETLKISGQDVGALLADLVSRQNADGGWGSNKNYLSNPVDTSLALKALSAAGYTDHNTIASAIDYLKSRQNVDGGWGNEEGGGIESTANALSAFNKFRQQYTLEDPIKNGVAFLNARQNSDGGFGNSPSTVYDTAMAVIALQEVNGLSSGIQQGLNFILGLQSGDGSWYGSAYQTALAISAVWNATVLPDLAINPQDITFTPATITGLPTSIVVQARIANLGRTSVPQARVVLYDGAISETAKVGEQSVVFPGQSTVGVSFPAVISDGNSHKFYLSVDPDNVVAESNEVNNVAVNMISPATTYDFEALSSGISFSQNPVDITKEVTISSKITNRGTMNAYNVPVKYYVDDGSGRTDISVATVDIPANATISSQVVWRASRAGTNLPVFVEVDSANAFMETSEANNKATANLTVNGSTQPNLTVSYTDIVLEPAVIQEQGSVTVRAAIRNEGFAPVAGAAVSLYLGVPGINGVLIGTQSILSLNAGMSSQVSFEWQNIAESGEKILYVRIDPDNLLGEITKEDNDAFTTVAILGLPDLAISANSITFNPPAPRDGDAVVITVNVQNLGQQPANNVNIRLTDNGTLIGSRLIARIDGNGQTSASVTLGTAGSSGAHEISVAVDPDNLIIERNKDNNIASRTFGVQDANLWVTEKFISPNGDGVKDSTEFFFRLTSAQSVTVSIMNERGEAVRTFSDETLKNTAAGNITWNGFNSEGMVVADGEYRITVLDAMGSGIGSSTVTIDNNRSPLLKALGTKYLQRSNLTCTLPDIEWQWFPDESGLLVRVNITNQNAPEYPAGLYTVSPDGQDILRIVPWEWSDRDPNYRYSLAGEISPDGNRILVVLDKWEMHDGYGIFAANQLWVVDKDGRNLRLVDSYDRTTSGITRHAGWLPDSGRLAYSFNGGLWLINSDGTGKAKIDSTAGVGLGNHRWSPDGTKMIYQYATHEPYAYHLELVTTAGEKHVLTLGADTGDYRFEWLNNEKIIILSNIDSGSNQRLWFVDAADTSHPVKLSDHATNLTLHPNRSRALYTEYTADRAFLKMVDALGNISTLYETRRYGVSSGTAGVKRNKRPLSGEITKVTPLPVSAVQNLSASWSPDGSKISFLDDVYEWIDECHAVQYIVVMDLKTNSRKAYPSSTCVYICGNYGGGSYHASLHDDTRTERIVSGDHFMNNIQKRSSIVRDKLINGSINGGYIACDAVFDPSCAHDGARNLRWLSDNVSLLGEDYHGLFTVNSGDGTKVYLPIDEDVTLSPLGRYFTYERYVEPSSVCYNRSYSDTWAISSLLNLTADLTVRKEKSAVILRGTATDLHFESYRIEYADAQNPSVWKLIKPPADVSVINDVFAMWVPPSEGVFHVRLTVWDKAGNVQQDRKRVSWGLSASIGNLYKTHDLISPNGDGIKDLLELHYTVFEPVNFEFNIYDEKGNLVRVYAKSHASAGEDYMAWDGRDKNGQTVSDGKYRIQVLDYEFFVTVDITAPVTDIALSPILRHCKTLPGDQLPLSCGLQTRLDGLAYDLNFGSWIMEYGTGDNPEDWSEYLRGENTLAAPDKNGTILLPPRIIEVTTFQDNNLAWLIGKKFRLAAADYAANRSTAITNHLEEKVILHMWDDKYLPAAEGNCSDEHCPRLPANLVRSGIHDLDVLVTVRTPVVGMFVEHWNGRQWAASPVAADLLNGYVRVRWDNTALNLNDIYLIRLLAVDETGREHHTGMYSIKPLLSLAALCDGSAFAYNHLPQKLGLLRIQISSADDADYAVPQDWVVYDTARGDSVPEGKFQFLDPLRNGNRIKTGRNYTFTMTATQSGSDPQSYDPVTLPYPPKCGAMKLEVTYPEAAECNALSGTADLGVKIMTQNAQDFIARYVSVDYYLVNGAERKQLGHVDLSGHSNTMIRIDTTQIPEGDYGIDAVLRYVELNNDVQVIKAAAGLVVDRKLPAAAITYPTPSATTCPVKGNGAGSERIEIPIEGVAADLSGIRSYGFNYGIGDNLEAPLTADVHDILNAAVQGKLGAWDITDLQGTDYNLKLRVVDKVGNTSCFATKLSIDKRMDIFVGSDKQLFSPNGDGILDDVAIHYEISEYAKVDVKVFRLLEQTDRSFILDQTPVRTIAARLTHLGGAAYATWDGTTDQGLTAADDIYGIAILATDSCNNTGVKWTAVRVDNTPPSTVITYPRPPDVLSTVVEVKGTADDLHFQSYVIEAGPGEQPQSFTQVASGKSAVAGTAELGKWNTYGLQGLWTLRLTARDAVGNEQATAVTVNLGQRTSLIKTMSAEPSVFSPNGDGKLDAPEIRYELTEACQIRIEIQDVTTSATLKTFTLAALPAGVHTFSWDGKNDAGSRVADGRYFVRLTAALNANSSVVQTELLTVAVDSTTPTITVVQPLHEAYLKVNTLSIIGSIQDQNIKEYALVYTGDQGAATVDRGNRNRENFTFGSLADIPEGKYTLNIRALDQAENEKENNIIITIDTTPPKVTLSAPAAGEYYGSGRNIVSVAGAIVEKNIEYYALRYGPGDNPVQWVNLQSGDSVPANPGLLAWKVGKEDGVADGVYTLSLYARDRAQWAAESRSRIIIDNTPPVASIASLKNGDYVRAASDIRGTAFDANLDQYNLEMSAGSCGSAFKWVSLKKSFLSVVNSPLAFWQAIPADGDYCIRLTATDKTGQKTEASIQVKVDTLPPGSPVLSGKIENKTAASLSWTKNQETDLAGYNLFRDGRKVNTELLSAIACLDAGLKDGHYAYTITAVDYAGNESKPSNAVVVKVDLMGPAVRIGSPLDGARVGGLLDIKGTAFSAEDFKQYRLSIGRGTGPASWSVIRTSSVSEQYGSLAQWDTLGLPDGVYSIKLEAEDLNGNVGVCQISVMVDNTAPQATVLLTAAANGSDVALTWQAATAPDLAGYLLYRNGQLANVSGVVIGNLKPYLLSGTAFIDRVLPDGRMRYDVVVMDEAGNMSDLSNSLEVTIDTHPPHITITEPLNLAKFQSKILLRGESADLDIATVLFQYKKAGETAWRTLGNVIIKLPFVAYLDPAALGLAYGDYNVRAVATDKGGNMDSTPSSITLKYTDLAAPQSPSAVKALVSGGDVTVTWTPSAETDINGYNIYRMSGAGTKTKLNAAVLKDATFRDNGLADGSYSYVVTAMDTYANESGASDAATAKIYAPKLSQPYTPVGQSTILLSGAEGGAGNSIEVLVDPGTGPVTGGTATADDVGAFSISALNLQPGENRITAVAKDTAGNTSKTSENVYIVFNETPAVPTGFGLSVQNHDVQLTWNPNAEADISGYNLYRNGTKVNGSLPVTSGTVTASTSNYSDPARAFDGNASTDWYSYSRISPASPVWLQITLSSPELINRLETDWRFFTDVYGAQTIYGGKNFEIQVWSGHAWITHDQVTGNTDVQNVFAFSPPYRTDRIRIHITEANDPGNFGLVEVRIKKDQLISLVSYTDGGLADGRYPYRLTAVDYFGFESAPTEVVRADVGDVTRPAAPLNLTAAASDANVTLTWNANSDPDLAGYAVYRKIGGDWIRLNSGALSAVNTFTDIGLINGSHLYRVTAVDSAGNESLPSNEAQVNVYVAPPAPPELLISVVEQGGALNATWRFSGLQPSGYHLYRGLLSGGPYARVNDALIGVTNLIDGHLTNGTTYYYVVTAVDAIGNESIHSNEATGTPRDSAAPARPLIYFPAIHGQQATLYQGTTDVAGSAEPGSTVELFKNGKSQGSVTAAERLTTRTMALQNVEYISVSPNGRMLVYFREGNLWLMDSMSSEVRKITDQYSSVAWAPDSMSFAYSDSQYRLRFHDIKTGTSSALNADPDSGSDEEGLSWSFDQSKVAFVRRSSECSVWVKKLRTGESRQVASAWDINRAKLSPDGNKLAYFIDHDLYVVRVDNLEAVGIDSSTDGNSINWSPDSKMLAYVSKKDAPDSVLIVDTDANQTVRNIRAAGLAALPVWAPDGKRLAYLQGNKNGYSLTEAQFDTEETKVLSSNISKYDCGLDWLRSGDLVYYDQDGLVTLSPGGKFIFKDNTLDAGVNELYVMAGDAYGNKGVASETVTLTFNTSVSPDLAVTADDIAVYPPYPKPGEKVSIFLSPRNVGSVAAENVNVAIYMMTNDQWTLLKSEIISSLAAGAAQQIEMEWSPAAASGRNTLAVILDPEDAIREVSEENNSASRDIVVMEQAGVEMTTVLDAAQYGVRQNVNIGIQVRNSGAAQDAVLSVFIEDQNGGNAGTLPPLELHLDYGSSGDVHLLWNTGLTLEGSYRVHSILKSVQSVIAENLALFKIVPDIKVEPVTLTMDKAIYLSNENTEMSVNITNASANVIISELTARIKITGPDGAMLFTDEKKITNFPTGATCSVKSLWNTAASLPGIYLVTLEVFVENNLVATKTTQFSIDTNAKVSGTVSAVPSSVLCGNDIKFDYTIRNTGNMDISSLPLQMSVIDPDTQDVLSRAESSIDLAINAERTDSFTVSTHGYRLKAYVAALQSKQQGRIEKIAEASFVVRDGLPPVVSILTPAAGAVFKSAINMAVTVVDDLSGVARVEYQIDAGEWKYLPVADAAAGRYSITWNPVKADEGAHTINFRAVDQALNTSLPVSTTIVINLTPVDAPVIQSPANNAAGVLDRVDIRGASKPGYTVTMEFQGASSTVQADAASGAFLFTGIQLAPGQNNFKFFAKDQSGNASDIIQHELIYLPLSTAITMDKPVYSVNENVNITATIANVSTSYPLGNLTARLSLIKSSGQTIILEERNIETLAAGTLLDMKKVWNTAVDPRGIYSVRIQMLDGGNPLSSVATTFEISGTAATGDGLTGAIQASPTLVFAGANVSIAYSVGNFGNEDVTALNVQTLILNSTTQNQVAALTDHLSIVRGGTVAGLNNLATSSLSPGVYRALLVADMPPPANPAKLATTEFEVKGGIEMTKTINSATANLLVWVNDKCLSDISSHQANCIKPHPGQKCVRLDLLENILKESEANYHVVYDNDDFADALRNPFYTDFVILGDHEPLTGYHAAELREQIHAGKGIVSSLYFKHRMDDIHHQTNHDDDHDSVFGYSYRGHLPGNRHFVTMPSGGLFGPMELEAKGEALRVEAEKPENVHAWIKWQNSYKCQPLPGEYPGILAHTYGWGKTIFFAFDFTASLTDETYDKSARLLTRAILHVHNAAMPDIYPSQKYVPVRISLKNIGDAVDLRLTEKYPSGLEIFDPLTGRWITDNPWTFNVRLPKEEIKNINYFVFTPEQTGLFTLQTDVEITEKRTSRFYDSVSVNLIVRNMDAHLAADILAALNALKTTSNADKKLIRSAVQFIKIVEARRVNSKRDVENNIKDIVQAVEKVIDIRKVDASGVRLMMDRLLQIWEAKAQTY